MSTFETIRKTIGKPITFQGKGVHSGKLCNITLLPAAANQNIVFKRLDMDGNSTVSAHIDNVSDDKLMRRTTLTENGVSVFTVEHVLSALHGLQVTDCIVEMNQEEPPFLDGSSKVYADAILNAGIVELNETITGYAPHHPLSFQTSESEIVVLPSDEFQVTFFYNSNHPGLSAQAYSISVSPQQYIENLASARTFCFFEEIEFMRNAGLIKGANLSSAVVIGRKSVINTSLRYDDEPVRHKILDFIGDIALLGFPVRGHYLVWKGGHKINAEFAKYLKKEICRE